MLALQAYRLTHQRLPDSLDALQGEFFDELPRDPYSGRDFVYFPTGLPEPAGPGEALRRANIAANDRTFDGGPCLWSPGPRLETKVWESTPAVPGENARYEAAGPDTKEVYYVDRWNDSWQPTPLFGYEAWHLGHWYPIDPDPR